MAKAKFRRAAQIKKPNPKVSIACRVSEDLRERLEDEAQSGGLTLGALIEAILEDYGRFLDEQKTKR